MVKFLIHRPIAVLMSTFGIIVLGIFASTYIPVSLMPDIDIPEITVQVSAENMSARELEDAIVKPLRASLVQLNHLEDIKSETSNGLSIVRLSFVHGSQLDYSFIEVNEKVDRAMATLPRDLERPRVIKASATDIPVFYLNITLKDLHGTKANGEVSQEFVDFNRFVNQVVRKRIEQIPEVAMVDVSGLVYPEILVVPDNRKLIALGLSLEELESIIKKEDLEIGSILVKDNQYQYNLRLGNTLENIKDLENIHINKNGKLYQLKDLAEVSEQSQKRQGLVVSNGKEAVAMAIIKQSDARMSDLRDALEEVIRNMGMEYTDMDFSINRDQTKLLDFAINNLAQSLLWGVLLAFVVMFLFLKDIRSPILIGISVPVSMVVCLLFFHLFHISINIISLSGLVLGTGLMIDNSIIVIDNIAQYREKGLSLSMACAIGTNEVFRPLLSSVLTTCAVFVPLIFLSGITGALFYDQAMAITIGLFVSLLVSIALLPVLYRQFYVKGTNTGKITRLIQKWNASDYDSLYEKGFRFIMRRQPMAFGIFVLLSALALLLFFMLPKSQMPELTSTETLMRLDWNEPINVGENKRRILELIRPVGDTIKDYTAQVGRQQFLLNKDSDAKPSEATLYIRTETPKDLVRIKNSLHRSVMEKYPKTVINYGEVDNIFSLIFSDGSAPLTVRLRNVESIGAGQNQRLINLWKALQEQLSDMALPPMAWEDYTTLLADRDKMTLYGVSADLLGNALESAFNEKEVLSIIDNQDFVPVILGGGEKTIGEVLNETMLKINDSTYYNLDQFVRVANGQDLKTITAGKEGEYYSIDLAIDEDHEESTMAKIRSVVDKDPQYNVLFSGSLAKDRVLVKELAIVLGITLLLLYFILASQFESLTLPLIILLEIPLSMAGAFLFLLFFGMSINLMSMTGIVVMSGIVINDSILKIDTIIQLQRQGHGLMKALLVAGQRRLKPILMTSLTTILALVPILFTSGLGGELQAPLAVALIGGMLMGTVVSLYFIPLCYYYLAKKKSYAV